jgi:hypothetical protein
VSNEVAANGNTAPPSGFRKPRRPRPDALVYDRAELAYVLHVSVRKIDELKHDLPRPIRVLGRKPHWRRRDVEDWLDRQK